jgi:hypothetical protein
MNEFTHVQCVWESLRPDSQSLRLTVPNGERLPLRAVI